VDLAIYLMVLVKQLGEMRIRNLQAVDLLNLVREFLG
jgi:hypothetical protein